MGGESRGALGSAVGSAVWLFPANAGRSRGAPSWGDATLDHPSQRPILGERLRLKGRGEGRECGHLEVVVGGCQRLPLKMRE